MPQMSSAAYCSLKKSMVMLSDLPENTGTTGLHSFDVLDYTLNVNIYHCFFTPYPTDFTASDIITFRVDSLLNSIQLNAADSSLLLIR